MNFVKFAVLLALPAICLAGCPFISGNGGAMPVDHPTLEKVGLANARGPRIPAGHAEALANLDFKAIKVDIAKVLHTSQDWWPADYGNYAPFMIRLAWHCAGSYRASDGRGGCDGGRQRFDPERSWADNTNLDKARRLLWSVKEKYPALSWGDLFILTGNVAIETMGGPILGFCAGRLDDDDGFWSQELGPSKIQEEFAPCKVNGTCTSPLGVTTVGLIYVNPEGPMGKPIPAQSALEVRDTFGRMGMDDEETVALIGGGHTYGKTHGACPKGAGPSPAEDPSNPWPGECGTGKGADTFTSGFEGPFTTNPTKWDNEYFNLLLNYEWEVHTGPGGHNQWRVKKDSKDRPVAPGPQGGKQDVMMLTSDISLLNDPAGSYQKIVKKFASDIKAFDDAFAHAWYKLTTRDMGPVTRCVGPDVPPPQPFQNPLPPAPKPSDLPDFAQVRKAVEAVIGDDKTKGPLLARLAWQCASTYRSTDFLGGCNGARLRFAPEKDWPANAGLDRALQLLEPVQKSFKNLSWADLIVLAGTVAVEKAGALPMKFCGGRVDATDNQGHPDYLQSRLTGTSKDTFLNLRQTILLSGLTPREYTALVGGHSMDPKHSDRVGFSGAWNDALSNEFFKSLFDEEWEYVKSEDLYRAKGKDLTVSYTDLMFRWDSELSVIAQEYATDNSLFLHEFSAAWLKLMNADRFDGPAKNICDKEETDNHPII